MLGMVLGIFIMFSGFTTRAEGICRGLNLTTMIQTSLGANSAGARFGSDVLKVSILRENILFTTNAVCDATSYHWMIGDFTITTSTPMISLNASDFLVFPAGGCDEFNEKENLSNGVLKTSISVKANAGLGNVVTLAVEIDGVGKCKENVYKSPKLPKLKGVG